MYRPLYLPLSTLMTGAYGPKPSMPSCTIVPEVIATSTTWRPQAAPSVGTSTPWSSDQVLGPRTRLSGLSGNAQPLPVVPEGDPPPEERFIPPPLAASLTAASNLAAVRGPTVPLAGCRPYACW